MHTALPLHLAFLFFTTLYLSSCAPSPHSTQTIEPWMSSIDNEVAALGASNWIIISEASFPTPAQSGTHTIVSPTTLPQTLEQVLQTIESTGHVKPRFYVTRESQSVTESYAPGIVAMRQQVDQALHGHEKQVLPQRSLDVLKNSATKGFRVLLIKTQTTLPYTSVYIELESGYWDGESESALRKQMR